MQLYSTIDGEVHAQNMSYRLDEQQCVGVQSARAGDLSVIRLQQVLWYPRPCFHTI